VVDGRGRVIVGDRENDRVQLFDGDGRFIAVWNGYAPYGLALSPDGELFVADARAEKVLRLDENGKVIQSWGGKGTEPGQFQTPHMLSFDAAGNLFVAEVTGQRLQKFTRKK
jgi:DNA-binding beta-propeller fold protein YncE